MIIWVDAQLSPALADWITANFTAKAVAVRDLGLRNAKDPEIFRAAKGAAVVVMTKDSDFVRLLDAHGPPPQIIWVTCGNTSNSRLRQILTNTLSKAIELLEAGEKLVEINGA